MNSFLAQLADRVHSSYQLNTHRISVIFPTRRAGVFFRDTLAKKVNKTFWAPSIYSIQDFVRSQSDLQFPEPLPLVYKLYEIYLKHMKKSDPSWEESFERFYSWGVLLMKDFDEIDKYLVNAKQLFQNVLELKEIDAFFSLSEEERHHLDLFWNSIRGETQEKPSQIQERFLKIWSSLYGVYTELREQLIAEHLAYDGIAYRQLAEEVQQNTDIIPFDKVIFAGFNALSTSEITMIETLLKADKAEVFWDVDQSYFPLDDAKSDHSLPLGWKAGKFIQSCYRRWKEYEVHLIRSNMLEEEKHVYFCGIPSQAGQSSYIAQQFQSLTIEPEKYQQYSIVLADEKLLFPVLYALPANLPAINITMGFPLKQTHIYHLFSSVAKLIRSLNIEGDQCQMSYKYVLEILQNAFVRTSEPTIIQNIQSTIHKDNLLVLSPAYLDAHFELPPLIKHIFSPPISNEEIVPYYEKLFQLMMDIAHENKAYPEAEYTFRFYLLFNQLKDVLIQLNYSIELQSFGQLFKEVMQHTSIPFEGEPLRGLQIMGFLETRVLDFEKVFVLAANEGSLPDTRKDNSFIPYNLRRAFGLPTYEDRDAIFAYHFFRLIQRAKEVHLIYNSQIKDYSGGGEKSRFLLQLQFFLKDYPSFHIHQRHLHTKAPYVSPREITIKQHPDIQQILHRKYVFLQDRQPYLSASAINTYLSCSLKFYFRYIAGLRESDQIEETMEANTFGSILHQTLEDFYKPYLHSKAVVDEHALGNVSKALKQYLIKAFEDHRLSWSQELKGKNYLMKDAIYLLCEKVLKADQKLVPFNIKYLENPDTFFHLLPVEEMQIKLNGMLDRVDYVIDEKLVRIVDYKTGDMEPKLDVPISTCFKDDRYKEVLQGYLYAYLFYQQEPQYNVQVGFYPLRRMGDGLKLLNHGNPISSHELAEFEDHLKELIRRMFSDAYFQTKDEKKCIYCSYREICQRN